MVWVPSFAGGGAERVMLDLAAGFAERGHETLVAVGEAAGPLASEVDRRVEVVALHRRRVATALVPLSRLIRARRPDALLSAMTHANVIAILAARAAGSHTKIVVSEHNAVRERVVRARGFLARAQYRLAARLYRAVEVVAVSRGVADDLCTTLDLSRQRVSVIYDPVRTRSPSATGPAPHPWLDGTTPVILGAGRLTHQKGFDLLLRAFAIVRGRIEARLIVVGDGPERPALERLALELGVAEEVALPGFTNDAPSYMARASCVALSSRWEGFGLVIVEALAAGAPVAAFDCPWGPAEILEGGKHGALAAPGDVPALARAIETALAEGRGAAAVARRSARARDFDRDRAIDAYLRLLAPA
jgi:glycosyltransferase involved in cell wall biosynthesis